MSYRIDSPNKWPITIPSATPTSDGVMTAAQAAALAALSPPGDWSLWATLGLQNGFTVGVAPVFQPARSRIEGTLVRLDGVVKGPGGGVADNAGIVQLPVAQRPSVIRYLTAHYKDVVGDASPVICEIGIDDAFGTGTGTPRGSCSTARCCRRTSTCFWTDSASYSEPSFFGGRL